MSRPLSEREQRHANRSLAGHSRDKDRTRWKRKVAGQAPPKQDRRQGRERDDDESLEDVLPDGEDE